MGRVPSGCAALTSAPARICPSAALWFPASMRLARESFWACAIRGNAAMKIVRNGFKRCLRLNHIGVQFVMVRPQTFGRVVEEFRGIFPGAGKTFQEAFFQHVFGTIAFADLFEKTCANLFHYVALRLEFSLSHHGAICGDDPGLVIAK